MVLRMGDGPVANLPPGLDAYAGYNGPSGIGETYAEVVAKFPNARHLSISVHGQAADCGDVESGALTNWQGFTVGYCSVSRAQSLIDTYGRPEKLWLAHYTNVAHICSAVCGFGFKGTADGTQWTDHGGAWDESLLLDSFFSFQTPDPYKELDMASMVVANDPAGELIIVGNAKDNGNLLQFVRRADGSWDVIDVSDAATAKAHANNPADTRFYALAP